MAVRLERLGRTKQTSLNQRNIKRWSEYTQEKSDFSTACTSPGPETLYSLATSSRPDNDTRQAQDEDQTKALLLPTWRTLVFSPFSQESGSKTLQRRLPDLLLLNDEVLVCRAGTVLDHRWDIM